jgi:hypothetical protein
MKYLRIIILVGFLLITWSNPSTTEAGWMDKVKGIANAVVNPEIELDKRAREKFPEMAAQMEKLFDYLEKNTNIKFSKEERLLELNRQEDALLCTIGEDEVLMAFICYDQSFNTSDTARTTRSFFSEDGFDMEFNGNMAMLYFAEITPLSLRKYFNKFKR